MGTLKSSEEYDVAMQDALSNATTPKEAHTILAKHGVSLIDNRLWDALESMPIGLEALIEDDEDD